MDWTNEAFRKEVLKLAKGCADRADLRSKLEAQTGEAVSSDMLRNAWKRWEQKKEAPPIDEVIGGGPKAKEPKPVKMVYPQGTKPIEAPVDSTTTADGDLPKILVCDGDLHYPIQDPYVEAAKFKLISDLKPNAYVNIGDLYDFWPISSHEKDAARLMDGKGLLQAEFNSAKPYWREVCKHTSGDIHFILGNHENRLNRLINANIGLFKLDAFEWKKMAEIPDRVRVHKYGTQLRVGPMTFEHGDRIGGRFGVAHPAHWFMQNKGTRNVLFGHTHRSETKHRTVYDENGEPHTYVAINQGHGSNVAEQTYAYEPNWQHGLTVMEYWKDGNKPRFTAMPITIVNGRFSFHGKVYDGGRPSPWNKR